MEEERPSVTKYLKNVSGKIMKIFGKYEQRRRERKKKRKTSCCEMTKRERKKYKIKYKKNVILEIIKKEREKKKYITVMRETDRQTNKQKMKK